MLFKLVLLVTVLVALGCIAHRWSPPVDEVRVEANPGLFGWIKADRRMADGQWVRDVSILIVIAGPHRLRGTDCLLVINGAHTFRFVPNPSHTWEFRAPFAEGDHEVFVSVGHVSRKLSIHVWRES